MQPRRETLSRQRNILLFMLILISSATNMDRAITTLVLQPIKEDFSLSDSWIGLISGGPFAVVYSLASIPLALAADRGNRKRILLVCFAIWIVMMFLCGLASSTMWLIVARMGVGVGEAGIIPTSHAIIAEAFPPIKRGGAFTAYSLSTVMAAPIAYSIGGWLIASFGWRSIFLGAAIISIPIAILGGFSIREPARRVTSLAIGSTRRAPLDDGAKKKTHFATLTMIGAGCAGYSIYTYGPLGFLPTYLLRYTGVSMVKLGLTLGVTTTIASIAGAAIGALLADRLAARSLRWQVYLPAVGLLATAPLTLATFLLNNFVYVMIAFGIIAALLFATIPAVYAAIQHLTGDKHRTISIALILAAMNLIGMTVGPLGTGYISDVLQLSHGKEGLRLAMICVSAILIPAAIVLFIAAQRCPRRDETTDPSIVSVPETN